MTAKPSLTRNATLNFISSILPICVALVTTPIYLHYIGTARYGVLAIVWMIQGYFGFLDMGLSAATANRIAQLTNAQHSEREAVLWTALILNIALGLVCGIVLYIAMHLLLPYFNLGPKLQAELLPALPYVASLMPLSNLIGVLTGALSGRERFGVLTLVQLPITLMYQLSPLAAAFFFGPSLRYVVFGTLVPSVCTVLLYALVVWRVFPLRFTSGPRPDLISKLFSYGAWMSAQNLTAALHETADRIMIGHALGPQAVAYYQVPFNLAVRVRLLPNVISRTLFPRLSSLEATHATSLSAITVRGFAAVLTPMIVFGMFLMHPFLSLWVGQEFAARSVSVGETILVGAWFNCLALIAGCHLQAIGRPGVPARLLVYELVPFLAFLWWAMHTFGVLGAALAWSARCVVDGVLIFHAARLDTRPLRMLAAPTLIIGVAYVGTLTLTPLTWPSIAMWIGATGVALAWAAHAEPLLSARVLGLFASMRSRWVQSH
ncbi:flippase [Paraburkholderia dinghuensis]|nr:flippase [Paraburkholderia dinghuensis]